MDKRKIKVLLIDDQMIIGEAVRRMLAEDKDIEYKSIQDPSCAIKTAIEFSPTVILQDLVMPDIDGLTLVKFFRANEKLKDIPLLVLSTKEDPKIKAEAFSLGANDYLVKLPDKIELIARIRHHSNGYINLIERNEAHLALIESQKELNAELSQAAEYVRSLLPLPIDGKIKTDWRFIPSTSLGGDTFDYYWIDDKHLAMYLLDVCGHGVGAALLSISAMNVLRSQSLPNVDFKKPENVLAGLNENFQMDNHNGLYFTIWYGVFNVETREITYSSGGHPPAVLVSGPDASHLKIRELQTKGFIIGGFLDAVFVSDVCKLDEINYLYYFSDGTYEVFNADEKIMEYSEFSAELCKLSSESDGNLDSLVKFVQNYQQSEQFEDDFSIVKIII